MVGRAGSGGKPSRNADGGVEGSRDADRGELEYTCDCERGGVGGVKGLLGLLEEEDE